MSVVDEPPVLADHLLIGIGHGDDSIADVHPCVGRSLVDEGLEDGRLDTHARGLGLLVKDPVLQALYTCKSVHER